ncbi:MAG: YfhO family protein [Treponema sp.]|nr:YfhO family protein [Treponema sp.]
MAKKKRKKIQLQNAEQPAVIIPVSEKTGHSADIKCLALSFFLPFIIMGTAFALHKVYPFGDNSIFVRDLFHQSYPFLSGFLHKLSAGTISPWSWTAVLGYDYLSGIAYYLASPLNLLAVLAPHTWLNEMLTIILLVKIGFAGLFTCMFLRYVFRQSGASGSPAILSGYTLPVFSALYALCAFTLGYYWVIQWFDGFALLPLVMLGLLALMRENKWRLYVISLALTVLINFYIGFFICVFTAISFFSLCIIQKLGRSDFLRKLGLIAGCSVLAIGMTAVLLLPSRLVLQNTFSAESTFPTEIIFYSSFFDILGNFISFTPPTTYGGLPNLYCGMISILLLGLFFYSPGVSRREKTVFAVILGFLLVSCHVNILHYIMHGFSNPIHLPFRFTFLISFTLIVMACRALLLTGGITKQGLAAMGISGTLFLLFAVLGAQETPAIIGSAVLGVVYLLIIYFGIKNSRAQPFFKVAFLLLIIIELFISSWISVKTNTVTNRYEYPDSYDQIQSLLNIRQQESVYFSRTEMMPSFTFNDPSLFNYNGVSLFSSVLNADLLRFLEGLGMLVSKEVNGIVYTQITPLANMFINMRYLITHGGHPADNGIYWEIIGREGDLLLSENLRYLPLGFMVKEDLAGFSHTVDNPFITQNNLFSRATGLDGDLFAISEISSRQGYRAWRFEMPSDGMLYACRKSEIEDTLSVFVNGRLNSNINMNNTIPIFFPIGHFLQGDRISLTRENDDLIYIGYLDSALFDQGYELLAGQPLILTKFTDTEVAGHVTALEDGLLYTSIPYNKNWSVYVNGVESEIVLIDNAMTAVRLNEGTHHVEFRYFNKSLAAGFIVSLVSLAVFFITILLNRFIKVNKIPRSE